MLSFFGRRKSAQPQVIVRTQTEYVTSPDDEAMRARHESLLVDADKEYARIHRDVKRELARRENTGVYDAELVVRNLAKMEILSDVVARIKGSDHVAETWRMELLDSQMQDNKFPVTSFLSGLDPIYI